MELAKTTEANILLTEDIETAVKNVDFLYTDVWVSMGEPDSVWGERIRLLQRYQVNRQVLRLNGQSPRKIHAPPTGKS